MRKLLTSGVAALALAGVLATGSANAAPNPPATTVGQNLIAVGSPVTAAFLFASAADDSDLDVALNAGAASFLFSNSNLVTNNASLIGATVVIPAAVGDLMTFTLNNLTSAVSFSTGAGSTNVAYLASSSVATIEAALNVDLSVAAEAALASLALIGNVTVIAFEDRTLEASDRDFNDLIFAFSQVGGVVVPEPASLALLGAGLLGLGVAVRRRRRA